MGYLTSLVSIENSDQSQFGGLLVKSVVALSKRVTVGKNAKSSKTKNREHVNFFCFMGVSYGNNSSFFVIKHCTFDVL